MLAFTLIRAVRPRTQRGASAPRETLGRKAPASRSVRADKTRANGNRAIRPYAGPWRSSPTEDRVAPQARRTAVMHVNLTVEVSEAASELLASRLVPKPVRSKTLRSQ